MRSDVTYYRNIAEMSKERPLDWGQWVPLVSRLREEVHKVSMCSEWGVVNGKKKSGWVQGELVDPKEEMLSIWGDACNLESIATDDGGSFDEMKVFRGLYAKADRLASVLGVAT